jgi:adenylosuccinate synthase
VVDLAFGDCGKGTIVDFLVRAHAADLVVRFNGGPQAGHNVVTPDLRHHTFSQFGSGTFVPGTRTFLSRFMLIEPYALFREEAHLRQIGVQDAFERLLIDRRCVVITPIHQAANRLRELARGAAAHGTCGMGFGETVADMLRHPDLMIRAGDLADRSRVAARLAKIRELKRAELADVILAVHGHPAAEPALTTLLQPSWTDVALDHYTELGKLVGITGERGSERLLRESNATVFEGAQGVLLDEDYGFHPHTTWSKTTFANADALLDESGFAGDRTRTGVLRSYFTRHGAGPFVSEDPSLRAALPEPHNDDYSWQGRFRVGRFDLVAARYAADVIGRVDALAVTHMDRYAALGGRVCVRYDLDSGPLDRIPVRRSTTLQAQAELTALLGRATPVYESLPAGNPGIWLERIAGELGAPIQIVSTGPTAADKRMLLRARS